MSDLIVTQWDLQRRAELELSRAAFESSSNFVELVAEADRRGYRRITLAEQMDPGCVDAYSWQGGVWVKKEMRTQPRKQLKEI